MDRKLFVRQGEGFILVMSLIKSFCIFIGESIKNLLSFNIHQAQL